jgi:Uncharacterized protein conserved in bacteria
MTKVYVAFLRGINVGGKNIIKMADLKSLFEKMGLSKVQTYIQSGNVLFESGMNELTLRDKIEEDIRNTFGYSVYVVLRTGRELEQVIINCPYSVEEITEAEQKSGVESLYVALLDRNPTAAAIEQVGKYKSTSEVYIIIERDVFLLFSNSIRNSKLVNNLHKLDTRVTVRNWKTITRLVELARSIGDSSAL